MVLFLTLPVLLSWRRQGRDSLCNKHLAMRVRLDPHPVEEAHWWDKGTRVTDHPNGTSTTVRCWNSKVEYQAWHRAPLPELFLFRSAIDYEAAAMRRKRSAPARNRDIVANRCGLVRGGHGPENLAAWLARA
jgi:hypothetical protein